MDDSTGGFDSTERETQDTGMEPGSGSDTGLDPTKEHDRESGGMGSGTRGRAKDPEQGQGGDASEATQDAQDGSADPL